MTENKPKGRRKIGAVGVAYLEALAEKEAREKATARAAMARMAVRMKGAAA